MGSHPVETSLIHWVQLVNAANGLEYMHSLQMVHGDLKGVRLYG